MFWKRIEMDEHLYFLESWEKYKIISNEIQVLCKIRFFDKVRLYSLKRGTCFSFEGIAQQVEVRELYSSALFL
jgi:hypothetical protein